MKPVVIERVRLWDPATRRLTKEGCVLSDRIHKMVADVYREMCEEADYEPFDVRDIFFHASHYAAAGHSIDIAHHICMAQREKEES